MKPSKIITLMLIVAIIAAAHPCNALRPMRKCEVRSGCGIDAAPRVIEVDGNLIPFYAADKKPNLVAVHLEREDGDGGASEYSLERTLDFIEDSARHFRAIAEVYSDKYTPRILVSGTFLLKAKTGVIDPRTLSRTFNFPHLFMLVGGHINGCLPCFLGSCHQWYIMSKDDLNPRNLEVHILKEYTWDRAKWGEHKQPQEEVNGQKQDWITKFLASTLVIDSKFTEYNCALFDNDQLLRYECHDPSLPWFTMFIWDDYEAHERFVARVRGDGIQPKANPASRSALRAVRECEIVCE